MKVSIVSPTYNERDNIEKFIRRLRALEIDSEIIIVDDNSPDGTGQIADQLAKECDNLRVLHRPGKRGLGSAVAEGFSLATGDIWCVTDSDMSHEIERIPEMVMLIEQGKANLVVGSRYIKGGDIKNWSLTRKLYSRGAIMLARPLTRIKDCVSGFFLLKKRILEGVELTAKGYKIGLEIIIKSQHDNKIVEFPYMFIDRHRGESKLNAGEFMDYIGLLRHLIHYKIKTRWKKIDTIAVKMSPKELFR